MEKHWKSKKIVGSFLLCVSLFSNLVASKAFADIAITSDAISKILQLKKVQISEHPLNEETQTIKIQFGKLNETEFQRISAHFQYPDSAISQIKYRKDKNYELLDFLVPKMQSMHGSFFFGSENIPWLRPLTGAGGEDVNHITNCYSTVHDILLTDRFPTTSFIYTSDENLAAQLLTSSVYSSSIRADELRAYDYFLIFERQSDGTRILRHAATYLVGGVIFEKTGDSEVDFYQLNTLEKAIEFYQKGYGANVIEVDYRRRQRSFPTQSELWSVQALGNLSTADKQMIPSDKLDKLVVSEGFEGRRIYNVIQSVSILRNKTDKYILNPRDAMSKNFKWPRPQSGPIKNPFED